LPFSYSFLLVVEKAGQKTSGLIEAYLPGYPISFYENDGKWDIV